MRRHRQYPFVAPHTGQLSRTRIRRYVAALSHDFGTPISALQMAAHQMASLVDADDGAMRPLLDGMAAALEVMGALKRKAIDIGRLQLGESLVPERGPFDIRGIVLHKLPAIVRYMPHNEEVRVEYFVSDDIAEAVDTDGSWVFMMVLNFVSNAFKSTQFGSVSVSARLAAGMLRIAVSDTGIGVSKSIENNLFKAFKQASRWQSGTGLGLYHVHQLALALGGSVGYQPNIQAGNGATFWVDLPYYPTSLPTRGVPRSAEPDHEQEENGGIPGAVVRPSALTRPATRQPR